MKQKIFLSMGLGVLMLTLVQVAPAYALSCLPVDMYVKDVVGNNDIVVFIGTATKQTFEDTQTTEVIAVDSALQGYVEKTLFAYHEKDETWGYYCNQGPGKLNEQGLYVAMRDNTGTYTVTQRLLLTDPLVATLTADIEEAAVEGGTMEISSEDRVNQIMTTIHELLVRIQSLMKELLYWKNN